MKNTLYTLVFAASILFVGAVQTQADVVADASSDTDQDAVVSAAVIVNSAASSDADQDGAAGATSNSSGNLAQDGSAGVTSNPSGNLAQDGQAGVTSNPSGDLDQDGPVTGTPGNGGNNPGGNTGGNGTGGGTSSGGSSSSSSGGSVLLGYNPMVLGASVTSCPLITDYLKLGGTNNPIQVTKLQIFLKSSEKADVTVNGIFDQKTEAAVKDFQKKYLSDILGPWDATRSTGFVYITTTKKINALACASPITLSAEERAIIAAYKAKGAADQSVDAEIVPSTGSGDSSTITIDTTDESNDNVAAASEASVLSRFWSFIKSLFK